MNQSWPVAELDPIRRLKVMGATIPGVPQRHAAKNTIHLDLLVDTLSVRGCAEINAVGVNKLGPSDHVEHERRSVTATTVSGHRYDIGEANGAAPWAMRVRHSDFQSADRRGDDYAGDLDNWEPSTTCIAGETLEPLLGVAPPRPERRVVVEQARPERQQPRSVLNSCDPQAAAACRAQVPMLVHRSSWP